MPVARAGDRFGHTPLGILDGAALVVTAGAIILETVADEQLRAFRLAPATPGRILDTGVWSLCRHPNYLGELTFWWGLYLFGLAADPSWWWAFVGPLAITLMFARVSVRLIDKRSLARRPGYGEHIEARAGSVSVAVGEARRASGRQPLQNSDPIRFARLPPP